jgi:hypothetical protein
MPDMLHSQAQESAQSPLVTGLPSVPMATPSRKTFSSPVMTLSGQSSTVKSASFTSATPAP